MPLGGGGPGGGLALREQDKRQCHADLTGGTGLRPSDGSHRGTAAGDCCAAVSTAVAVLLAGGEREDALAAARNAAGRMDLFSGDLIPSVDAVEATRCAFFCFRQAASVRDCIEQAATLGGDTDTIAAIAGGLAGVYFGMENIPKEWVCRIGIRKRIAVCAGSLTSARGAARRV